MHLLIQILRKMGFALLNILLAACIGLGLLCAVYAIPTGQINERVRESAPLMEAEGTYPILYDWCHSQLDNWTDSVMLLTAAYGDEGNLVSRALSNKRGAIDGLYPWNVLVAHYVRGEDFTRESAYARYWHGYLVFLKPLLFFMTYSGIRKLNAGMQGIMILVICYLLFRRKRPILIIPCLVAWLMMMPVTLVKSLQFSACFYVTCMTMIGLLLVRNRSRVGYVFLYAGILTAYFDLLTYPIITFGIPAAMYLSLHSEASLRKDGGRLVGFGLCWVFGYGGMWAGKWVLGNLLTDMDVIQNAVNELILRSGAYSDNGMDRYGLWECFRWNTEAFFHTPFAWLIPAAILGIAENIWYLGRANAAGRYRTKWEKTAGENIASRYGNLREKGTEGSIRRRRGGWDPSMLYFLVIALLPFLWYACTINHSTIHYWFTNKGISVTVFSILCAVCQFWPSKRSSENE